jgi:hypothetical protein
MMDDGRWLTVDVEERSDEIPPPLYGAGKAGGNGKEYNRYSGLSDFFD